MEAATVPVQFTSSSVIDNPASDGWDTEAFNLAASAQFKTLGRLLVSSDPIETSQLQPLVSADFSCPPLLPEGLTTVFSDKTIRVQRPASNLPDLSDNRYRGASGLADALRALNKPFAEAEDLRFSFKIISVQRAADTVITRQYFAISGRTTSGVLEQNASWSVRWISDRGGGPPRLAAISVEQFEQVETPGGPLFSDCTESVLGGNTSYRDQFGRGIDHWSKGSHAWQFFWGYSGLAVGDVNGDGLDDLYVCQESGLPNRLFVQQPDGSLLDTSAAAGVNWLQDSRSALLVDLDNDGDQDLAVAVYSGVVLAENDGSGNFTMRRVLEARGDPMSLSAVDYDRDGRLDLYVCVYEKEATTDDTDVGRTAGGSVDFVFHDANNGGINHLFRNQADEKKSWKFVDVTWKTGLDAHNRRWSLAAAWEDFDNDGDQDLYVANDYGRNCLYRNDEQEDGSRRFVDIAAEAGVEDSASGMSVSWGDYNRDGLMDIYVANMFSSAGSRITFQDQFKVDSPVEVKTRLQRFTRGSTLLKNTGTGTFEDTSESAAVTIGRWAWGSQFMDINNDGWQDMVVANGYVTGIADSGDL